MKLLRVFSETRVNADELLAGLGLTGYNRWAIVRKTHEVMATMKFGCDLKGKTLHIKMFVCENIFIILRNFRIL